MLPNCFPKISQDYKYQAGYKKYLKRIVYIQGAVVFLLKEVVSWWFFGYGGCASDILGGSFKYGEFSLQVFIKFKYRSNISTSMKKICKN